MADLSPMMKQYFQVKRENPDTLVFFRLGDFYELFYDDAKIASKELELTLTGRDCGQSERAPMCGVPFHSYESYVARLVAKGYKVAICEQMEDPALAKGLVKRDVVRVITPGTVMEGSMLDEAKNNYLCSVCAGPAQAGICFADISTGELHGTVLETGSQEALEPLLREELARFAPREVLVNPDAVSFRTLAPFLRDRLSAALECLTDADYGGEACAAAVKKQYRAETLEQLGLEGKEPLVRALGALLGYLEKTQRTGLERMEKVALYTKAQFMRLDLNARRNLELLETMRAKEKRGSLLWVLDRTCTAMGKRLLRSWLEQPLVGIAPITRRLDAVEELVGDSIRRGSLGDELDGISDMERLLTRIVYGSANARELRALCAAADHLPRIRELLEPSGATMLRELYRQIDPLEDLRKLIDSAIVDSPPFSIREGNMIREGYHRELDLLRETMTDGRGFLARIEAQEKERTGIPKLKIGYNRVFGYYIEISNSYKDQAPPEYVRKQTLANCERYITPQLKELESRILGAHEKSVQLETQLFEELRAKVSGEMARIQRTASALAQLDVLVSFARVSQENGYTRPAVDLSGKIVLKESRHPVVELLLDGAPFVPNDVELDRGENRVAVITGPNMAGKSTYMRQVALIVLMAQAGCFVPAASAHIGVVDAIFTRVGASDDVSAGQSTFMVEMTEVAEILRAATPDSLLILDEIGRGTSTFDGMSIARAVVEYVADSRQLGAKTMFATHYHELTELEEQLDGVKNYNIAVKKHGDDITFLRRIVRGGADDSFGIEVAKLAGVPDKVLRRAKQVLAELESGQAVSPPKRRKKAAPEEGLGQMSFTPPGETEAVERLRALDLNTLTPIECMNLLFELCKLVQK